MAYDVSDVEEFTYNDATFGATTVNHYICPPRGKVGFVRDLSVEITTAFVGTTTNPEIDVGLSSGDFTFGRYVLGTALATPYTALGMHKASDELWTGNPPRTLSDFTTNRILLDGGPYGVSPQNIVGGSSSTQQPLGRIPAGPFIVANVLSGTGANVRIFTNQSVANLLVGQTMWIRGILGATSALTSGNLVDGFNTISVINVAGGWFELTGSTFAGAYTTGGICNPVAVVTNKAAVGTPAGGGIVRVKIEWVGPQNV